MIYTNLIHFTSFSIYLLSTYLSPPFSSLFIIYNFFYIFKPSTMASKLKPNATTTQINEFLAQVRIPKFRIHLRLVEFNNAKDQQRKVTLYYNKLIAKGHLEDVAQCESEAFANANVLSVSIKSLTQKGSILML